MKKKAQGQMARHPYLFEVRPKHSYKDVETVFEYHIWR